MLSGRFQIETCCNTDYLFPISDLVLSTLESIHNAGILHGDIRPENILIDDLGVTIIDFGHATRCGNQKAKDEEYACLQSIIGLVHR